MVEQVVEGGVDGLHALGREPDDDAAPVPGVGVALDVAAGEQPVHAVGHRPAGHEGLRHELTGGELVRRPRTAQRGEHVELPAVEVVLGEGRSAGEVEVAGPAATRG